MRKSLAVAVAMLVAAGCTQESASGEAAEQVPQPHQVAAPAEPCSESPLAYHPFPDGVKIEGEFMVRNDRIIQAQNGAQRRRVALELLGQDPVATAESVLAQMESMGFQRVQTPIREDGTVRLAATKKEAGRVNVNANPDPGKNRSHPESTGVLVIDWRISTPPVAVAGTANAG